MLCKRVQRPVWTRRAWHVIFKTYFEKRSFLVRVSCSRSRLQALQVFSPVFCRTFHIETATLRSKRDISVIFIHLHVVAKCIPKRLSVAVCSTNFVQLRWLRPPTASLHCSQCSLGLISSEASAELVARGSDCIIGRKSLSSASGGQRSVNRLFRYLFSGETFLACVLPSLNGPSLSELVQRLSGGSSRIACNLLSTLLKRSEF